mmetsp:Transcript_38611/g.100015  ORF Transcript_38611/g.100015 Transcript_38611/m.100015 type:complete len:217 (-) Transcript_38611:179-829(-)
MEMKGVSGASHSRKKTTVAAKTVPMHTKAANALRPSKEPRTLSNVVVITVECLAALASRSTRIKRMSWKASAKSSLKRVCFWLRIFLIKYSMYHGSVARMSTAFPPETKYWQGRSAMQMRRVISKVKRHVTTFSITVKKCSCSLVWSGTVSTMTHTIDTKMTPTTKICTDIVSKMSPKVLRTAPTAVGGRLLSEETQSSDVWTPLVMLAVRATKAS